MRYVAFILGTSLWLSSLNAKTESAFQRSIDGIGSVTHAPETKPQKRKVSFLQRVKTFFWALKSRFFPAADPAYYVVTILIALFITPLAVLIAGLWMKDDRWILHFLINLLIIIIAWALYFFTCGLGVFITLLLLLGAFAHALWYIIYIAR